MDKFLAILYIVVSMIGICANWYYAAREDKETSPLSASISTVFALIVIYLLWKAYLV